MRVILIPTISVIAQTCVLLHTYVYVNLRTDLSDSELEKIRLTATFLTYNTKIWHESLFNANIT